MRRDQFEIIPLSEVHHQPDVAWLLTVWPFEWTISHSDDGVYYMDIRIDLVLIEGGDLRKPDTRCAFRYGQFIYELEDGSIFRLLTNTHERVDKTIHLLAKCDSGFHFAS